MGVVSREHRRLHSPSGDVDWYKVIKYYSSTKHFIIELPAWWHDILDYKKVSGETEDKVNAAFRDAKKEYEERCTTRRKVILYQFQASAVINEYAENGKFKRVIFRKDEVSFSEGTALDFWWRVGYELRSSVDPKPKYIDLKERSISHGDHKVMDWTQQREDFFQALQANIDNLILKAHTFFKQDVKTVAQIVDQAKRFERLPDFSEKGGQHEE